MSKRKRWVATPTDLEAVTALQKKLNINPIFCQLLIQRGVTTFETAKGFFRPKLSDLHDPFLMQDMDKAVVRILQAIQHREKILLYGDYDVDGTTSVALMYTFLSRFEVNLDYYIPDRYKEGYGVSLESIAYAEKKGIQLIITMDCGIKAFEPLERANQLGIDCIVCDHHLPTDKLPTALAVLDPQRSDCNYPYTKLSGCGVVFKLVQAIAMQLELPAIVVEDLLEFVAVSNACDIVPITGENRILTYYGVQQLNQTQRPGFRALLLSAGKEPPLTISDIVFGIGPLINAAGRLADAYQALKVLLAEQFSEANEQVLILEERNKLRKEYDQRTLSEAIDLIKNEGIWDDRKSLVLYSPHWHKGIVGIVASRIVERYHRPTIILTASEGKVVGSARSIRGFDIHQAIGHCSDMLLNYGGHQHAAGLTLRAENVITFQDRFEGVVDSYLESELLIPTLTYNAELALNHITPKFWNILKQFAPYGPKNRNPVFLTRKVKSTKQSRLLRNNHLKLVVRQGKEVRHGIAFGQGDAFERMITGEPFDMCYTITENRWKGNTYLQLEVKDIRFGY